MKFGFTLPIRRIRREYDKNEETQNLIEELMGKLNDKDKGILKEIMSNQN